MDFNDQLQREMDGISAGAAEFMSTEDRKRLGVERSAASKAGNIYPERSEPARLAEVNYKTGRERPLEQGVSGGIGYSNMDGHNVVNHNKQYNNASPEEMQAFMSYLADNQVHEDPYGNKYKIHTKTGEKLFLEPGVDTSKLYMGPSQTDPNEMKVGVSRFGVKERYTPGLARNPDGSMAMQKGKPYGWAPGPDGIDADNAILNMNLTAGMANKAEAFFHGNKQNLGARKMFDDGTPEAAKFRTGHGSGSSEYYDRDKTSLFSNADPSKDVNMMKLLEGMGIPVNDDGRLWSATKGAAAKFGNMGQNALDRMNETTALLGESTGLMSEKEATRLRESDNSSTEDWEESLGVQTRFRDRANADLKQKVDSGDYIGAGMSVIRNLDIHLSESAPETMALMTGIPGIMLALNSRTKDNENEYKKTNGKEASLAEKAGMWATNAAVLLPEQLLIAGPLKGIFRDAVRRARGLKVGSGFQHAGTTLGKKARNIGIGVAGEAVQEMADQTQENFWNKGGAEDIGDAIDKLKSGKIISKNEMITAGIAGGVMGGAIRGAVETPGLAKATKNTYELHGAKKSFEEADKYLDAQDKEFAQMSLDSDNENYQMKRDEIATARAELKTAKASASPIASMSASSSPLVQAVATGIKTGHINMTANSINHKASPSVQSTIESEVATSPAMQSALGVSTEAVANMSKKEISKAVSTAMSKQATRTKLIQALSDDGKIKIFDSTVKGKELKKVEKGIVDQADQKFERMDYADEIRMDNNKRASAIVNKTKNKPLKQGDIDFEKSSTSAVPTLKEFMSAPFTRQKTRALEEISKYDNQSIRDAIDIAATPKERKWLQAVLDKRTSAKETAGIGGKNVSKVGSKDYVRIQDDESLGKDKHETLQSLRSMAARTEMEDVAEVSNAKKFIEKAKKAGHITAKQESILKNRLNKIDKKTKFDAVEEDKAVRALRAKAKGAMDDFNTAKASGVSSSTKPKFSADEGDVFRVKDNSGKEVDAEIIYVDDEDIIVEINGKDYTFNLATGKQSLLLGETEEFFGGRIHTPSSSNKSSQNQGGTSTDTDTDTELDDNEEQDEASAEAAMKSTLESMGEDFDPSTLTDEQLDKLSPELQKLFDC